MPPHKVIAVRPQTPDLFELTLTREGIAFESGDCVALACPTGESRPYSIASGTAETCLRFFIRRLSSGCVSHWLSEQQPGQLVEASSPFGWFRPGQLTPGFESRVFVASGTGMAPFVSALRSHPDCQPLAVLYGVRQLADAIELPYLQQRARLQLAVSREHAPPHHHGRVTDLLPTLPPQPPGTHYYLCGLDAMVNEVNAWLDARGVPFTHIHREIFFAA